MRNLKRVLSLTLASVMLMGMMVIGAGAAQSTAAGYPDVDKDEHNIEAIDVLQTVEVMIGYTEEEGGGFQPDKNVTRAEMMVIMGKLLNFDYNYYAATCPFTDVPEWARGWVGAAYANKVAVGRGDGIFDPDSPVTPVEASAFLMRALGYFQYSNDYAAGFEAATVLQGSNIGIYKGVSSSASEPMTRNQVAKMVLNTLESGMVQPDGNTINLTTPDGSVLTGKVNYVYVTSNENYAAAISDLQATAMGSNNTGYIVEMGERLYDGKLKLQNYSIDAFGRPSRHWEYDGKAIGTYIKKDLLKESYTVKVTGKELYDLLGAETVRDYKFTITIDGETEKDVLDHTAIIAPLTDKQYYFFDTTALNRSNTNQVGGTDKGVLTQVFVDGNKKEVHIAIINTYLAVADTDYNTRRNEVGFSIYNIARVQVNGVNYLVKSKRDGAGNDCIVSNEVVSGDEFDVADIQAEDVVLVHVANNEIKEILEPEVIDETTISAFRVNNYVVAEGTQYSYASTALYDTETLIRFVNDNMKDSIYRIYLDPYGYLIGLEEIDSELHYVFLTGINGYNENLRDATAIGNVVFLDGTSQNITINLKDSRIADGVNRFTTPSARATYDTYDMRTDTRISSLMNTWCAYSVDDNGVYTLKEVPNSWNTYNSAGNTAGHGQSHTGGTYDNGADTYYYAAGTAVNTAANGGKGNWLASDGADDEYWTINKGHVVLNGIPGTDWVRVYGDNDTVYLSAELDIITAKNVLTQGGEAMKPAVIITGAESVSVGVQDVDLKAWNAQAVVASNDDYKVNGMLYENVSDGVYTLFNKYGDVIAAMVVGGDDGSNISYAWVTSSNMIREGLVDGGWEYSREVLINGELVTLTEIESNGMATPDIAPSIDDSAASRSFWWEVKTKADGTVKSVKRIVWDTNRYAATSDYDTTGDHMYVYDIDNDAKNTTTVLNQSFGMTAFTNSNGDWVIPWDTISDIDGDPSVDYKVTAHGSTLHVEGKTGNWRGFAVSPTATIVVVKDEIIKRGNGQVDQNWKGEINYFTNDKSGRGVKQAVNALTNSNNFVGYIAAVLDNGRAETLIIYDKSGEDVLISDDTIPADDNIFAVENEGKMEVYYVNDDATWRITNKKIENAINKFLTEKQGFVIDEVTYDAKSETVNVRYYTDSTRTNFKTFIWEVVLNPEAKTLYDIDKATWDLVKW